MHVKSFKASLTIYAALSLGAGSLILFYLFLFFGPLSLFNIGMSNMQALVFDAFLCILFFLQHSILVRKSIRARLDKYIPAEYYGAFYAVSSGSLLLIMTLLWQTTYSIAVAGEAGYWMLKAVSVLCIIGFYWGVVSLRSFDPFGINKIKFATMKRKPKPDALTVKGPYLWVRHPLYFFSLVMIWSFPDLTADRLLFNVLWTVWITIATKFEERDLVLEFGNTYREYQARVPMLIPYKRPLRTN